ncbi:tetratricopeptide repeat protein [Microbulbifer marinus]|uniref:Tetratricopeptide repeat-containing protein n=1 Tax=Microbulbifer marinus TaxID=658218 RepID=A0A1H4B1I1_9GAMM|nr:tetratricopeptide repeat protein [Microbulbifer marinus]SEA41888.1 Tetratricopeptide repeat-containing protein [Microbulbifer marinus]
MAESCNYHSSAEAAWLCEPCSRHYCGDCIPGASANYHNGRPDCPLCRKPIDYIGASNSAKPFWQMGLFYFRYALQSGPLTVLALATGASLLISGLGILSLVLLLATVALVTRYNLLVIERLAEGQLQAPAFGDALDGNSAPLFVKVIGMTLIAGFVGYQFMKLGSGALQLYSIALSLLAPAAMIVLALEKSLRAAINPLKLLQFTLIIGWPYWLLWLATSAVSAAPGYLLLLVGDKLPPWAIVPVVAASTSYFYIVTSAMMGYICLARQQRLGITAAHDDEDSYLEEKEFERARALAEVQILMREGDFKTARRTLVDCLRRYPDDIALNERYYRLLLASQDKKALRELGPHLLEKFVRMDRAHKAAELYLATDPLPTIDKSHLRHGLAEALYRQQKYRPAAQLLNNLHKEDWDYRHLDAAYLLLAQIYIDGFNREDLARKLLAYVKQKFPNSSLRKQVDTLEEILQGAQVAG